MARPRSANERTRRDVIQLFSQLPRREQLEVFEQLRTYVSEDLGVETDADRLLDREREALRALDQVAAHLRSRGELAADTAPTAKQFDQAAAELGLDWDRSRIVRVFGLWRNAQRSLLGESVTEGPAQKRFRQQTGGRRRTHESPLAALDEWLKTDPSEHARADYDAFAKAENRRRGKRAPPLPTSAAVTKSLGMPWGSVLSIAQGDVTLEAERERLIEVELARRSETDLVGHGLVAAMFGRGADETNYYIDRGEFPRQVATVGKSKAWFVGDLLAFRDSGEVVEREEGEYQDEILDTAQLAKLIGRSPDTIRTYVHQANWRHVPEPQGKAGNQLYWLSSEVAKWRRSREKASAGRVKKGSKA
jgi:predicted DNA-binding transcriptional regulator AlpA